MILGLITDRGKRYVMSELIHQKQGTPIQIFKLFFKIPIYYSSAYFNGQFWLKGKLGKMFNMVFIQFVFKHKLERLQSPPHSLLLLMNDEFNARLLRGDAPKQEWVMATKMN
jgi:hypothetical protein